jgi:hypothetical protein
MRRCRKQMVDAWKRWKSNSHCPLPTTPCPRSTVYCPYATIPSRPKHPAQKFTPENPRFSGIIRKTPPILRGTSVKTHFPKSEQKNRPHRKTPCETAPAPKKCSTIHPQQFECGPAKTGTSRPPIVQLFSPKTRNNSSKETVHRIPHECQHTLIRLRLYRKGAENRISEVPRTFFRRTDIPVCQ